MPSRHVGWLIVFCVLAAGHGASAFEKEDGISREGLTEKRTAERWTALHGNWGMNDGAYCQHDPGKGQYYFTILNDAPAPEAMKVEVTGTAANSLGFVSFGFVLSYVDAENWSALRFGSYGNISALRTQNGQKQVTQLGTFRPEIGRKYRLVMLRRDDRVAVLLDGLLQCVLRTLPSERGGQVGLFTESASRFDNVETHRDAEVMVARLSNPASQAPRVRVPYARIVNGVFQDSFAEGGVCRWRDLRGAWRQKGSRYELQDRSFGRYMTVAPVLLEGGAIEGIATPLAPSSQKIPRPVFGVLAKWLDSANWVAVRYGEYGSISGLVQQDGKLDVVGMGPFLAETGKAYRFRVETVGKQLTVYVDGRRLGAFEAPFADHRGKVGLYTEAPTAFDDIRIEGALPEGSTQAGMVSGTPRLALEFAEFRLATGTTELLLPTQAGVRLYVRNMGTGSAILEALSVNGIDASEQPRAVSWWRQRPHVLTPGAVGEILFHLSALPTDLGLALWRDPQAKLTLPVTVKAYGAEPLLVPVTVTTQAPRLQINYIAFQPDLCRICIYLEQCGHRSGNATPLQLTQVSVNGLDLTDKTTFGSRSVAREIVPVVVNLSEALEEGQPVVITVATREGIRAGHAVRAFPARFPIQVTLLGKQTRPDAVEDIWRHHATAIGLCGAGKEHLIEAKELGLDAFHYATGLGALRRFDKPEYPAITGQWLDEMDRHPARYTHDMVQESREAYAREGRYIPLQMISLCSSRAMSSTERFEIGDATCGAYGYHGGALGEQFGRAASLPQREYRLARLPFLPYLRDAEMPVVIDPETHEVLGRSAGHRRCIEPREERWMTYGSLIQGAKGILHWNYGSGISQAPNWFSKTECVLRAGLGGALNHDPHGIRIPSDQAAELERVWDEIGRINVELRAIGPLVANSDVSHLAQVTTVSPEQASEGGPAAEAVALVSQLDAIVLIVLNHTIKHNWTGDADHGIDSYPPVRAIVELKLPPWLQGKHAFSVRHNGVDPVAPQRQKNDLFFDFDHVEVSEVVVVTDQPDLKATLADTIRRLNAIGNR